MYNVHVYTCVAIKACCRSAIFANESKSRGNSLKKDCDQVWNILHVSHAGSIRHMHACFAVTCIHSLILHAGSHILYSFFLCVCSPIRECVSIARKHLTLWRLVSCTLCMYITCGLVCSESSVPRAHGVTLAWLYRRCRVMIEACTAFTYCLMLLWAS